MNEIIIVITSVSIRASVDVETAALFKSFIEIVRRTKDTVIIIIIISDSHKNLYNLFPCISTHYYMY